MRRTGVRVEVDEAIRELQRAFPDSIVSVFEDGMGGANVVVESVSIGTRYEPAHTWLGGHISAQYPYADIYPVFMDSGVRRQDGRAFQPPITTGSTFCGRAAIQISRRNNKVQHPGQSAVAKFLKVIDFLDHCQ